jgi:uncharacterized protein YlxP (DUF503 family)
MQVFALQVWLYAPWVHSLKAKRMLVKSLTARIQNKFHVSAAEIDRQDAHQTIVLGFAAVCPSAGLADGMMEKIVAFIEGNTEAQITDIQKEIR